MKKLIQYSTLFVLFYCDNTYKMLVKSIYSSENIH